MKVLILLPIFFVSILDTNTVFTEKMWLFTSAVSSRIHDNKIFLKRYVNEEIGIKGNNEDITRILDDNSNFVLPKKGELLFYTKQKLSPFDLSPTEKSNKAFIRKKLSVTHKGEINGYDVFQLKGAISREMIDRKTGKVRIIELPLNYSVEILFNDEYFLIMSLEEGRGFEFYVKEKARKNILSKEKMNKLWIESIEKYCSKKGFILEDY